MYAVDKSGLLISAIFYLVWRRYMRSCLNGRTDPRLPVFSDRLSKNLLEKGYDPVRVKDVIDKIIDRNRIFGIIK